MSLAPAVDRQSSARSQEARTEPPTRNSARTRGGLSGHFGEVRHVDVKRQRVEGVCYRLEVRGLLGFRV